jgi:hypothetical protein
MVTLTATLMELDERGQWLARALRNERYQTIQGATVRIDKFSEIPLRSVLSYERRFRLFDSLGRPRKAPLTQEEEKQLANTLRCYGDSYSGLCSFSPIVEMYEQGNRCAHCCYAQKWEMSRKEIADLGLPCGLNLSAPNDAPQQARITQINSMGRFAQWWIAFGGFEPITLKTSWRTQAALNALFGKRRGVPIDSDILDERCMGNN